VRAMRAPSVLGGRNNPRSAGERERLERTLGPGASPAPLPAETGQTPACSAARNSIDPQLMRGSPAWARRACLRRPGVDAALPETTMGSGWLCRRAGSRAVAATAP